MLPFMVVRTHIHPDLTIYSQELSGWTVSTAEFNANEGFHQAVTSIWPFLVQDNVNEGDDQYILPFTPTLISNTMRGGGMHSPLSRLLRLVSRTATAISGNTDKDSIQHRRPCYRCPQLVMDILAEGAMSGGTTHRSPQLVSIPRPQSIAITKDI